VDHHKFQTDYETYRDIMPELLNPIETGDLSPEVLVRLYQSKLVYLESLRNKCFLEMNGMASSSFTASDYSLIIEAIALSRDQLRQVVVGAIETNLSRRFAM